MAEQQAIVFRQKSGDRSQESELVLAGIVGVVPRKHWFFSAVELSFEKSGMEGWWGFIQLTDGV